MVLLARAPSNRLPCRLLVPGGQLVLADRAPSNRLPAGPVGLLIPLGLLVQ